MFDACTSLPLPFPPALDRVFTAAQILATVFI